MCHPPALIGCCGGERRSWGHMATRQGASMKKLLVPAVGEVVNGGLRNLILEMWYGASLGGPKTCKGYILRVFLCPILLKIEGDYRLMTRNRKRLFKQLNAILTPPTKYSIKLVKCFSSVWYVIPLLLSLCFVAFFLAIWQWKTLEKTGRSMSNWCYWSEWLPDGGIQWLLLDLLNQTMHVVSYRRIAIAIKMVSFVGVFVDCCLFACCPGGCWCNTKQVVTQRQHLVASGVALDMPYWVMLTVLLLCTSVAIEMAGERGAFIHYCRFVIDNNCS